ncbi:hypothetical protein H4R20_004672, partial [Coemansia guatemalensis]
LMFLQDMCGFCCFSMRFVVFLDLFGTITMPTTLFYFAYLIYVAVTGLADVGYISLILIGCIYGVQAIIFILRREWQHIGWMLIYIMAYPLWAFVLPIYSFWHMDDFSWGNTRVVVGDGKRKIIIQDDKEFDPASIPQRRWREYEMELNAAGVLNAPPPNMNPNAGSTTKEDERMSMYSRQSAAMMSQFHTGSVYGYPGTGHMIDHYTMSRPGTPGTITPGGADHRYSMAAAVANPLSTFSQYGAPDNAAGMYGAAGAVSAGASNMARAQSPAAMTTRPHTVMSVSATSQISPLYQPASGSHDYGAGTMASSSSAALDMHQRPASSFVVPHSSSYLLQTDQTADMPSDAQIVDAIRRILATSDLTVMTKKKIRQQLAQEFNADISNRKDFISTTIDRTLSGQM